MTFVDYFVIHKDTSAIFTYNDLLARFDVELPLWGDLVEASAAGVALNRYNSKAVPCIRPDPFICSQKPVFNQFLYFLRFVIQSLLFFLCIGDYLIKLGLFIIKVGFTFRESGFRITYKGFLFINLRCKLFYLLVEKFDFKILKFNFL